jgi:hypothetical protein
MKDSSRNKNRNSQYEKRKPKTHTDYFLTNNMTSITNLDLILD